jgi:hypothetical protein
MASACGTDVVQLQGTGAQPKPACVSIPQSAGVLCLYCGADYSQQRGCLKCESPASASGCATCFWSDDVDGGTCQQCVDSSGNVTTVGCNELRTDLLTPTSTSSP